jgi:hypothetical protein
MSPFVKYSEGFKIRSLPGERQVMLSPGYGQGEHEYGRMPPKKKTAASFVQYVNEKIQRRLRG